MHRPAGTAAARLTLWTLVLATLAMALVQPADAGTQAAPEITDPAHDHKLTPAGMAVGSAGTLCDNGPPCFARIDILEVWIDTETADSFNVNIQLSNAPVAAAEYNSHYEFHATFGGTEVVAKVDTDANGPVAGDNVASASASGNILTFTLHKSIYGADTVGGSLTAVFAVGQAATARATAPATARATPPATPPATARATRPATRPATSPRPRRRPRRPTRPPRRRPAAPRPAPAAAARARPRNSTTRCTASPRLQGA